MIVVLSAAFHGTKAQTDKLAADWMTQMGRMTGKTCTSGAVLIKVERRDHRATLTTWNKQSLDEMFGPENIRIKAKRNTTFYRCLNCDCTHVQQTHHYCPGCGRKIFWIT